MYFCAFCVFLWLFTRGGNNAPPRGLRVNRYGVRQFDCRTPKPASGGDAAKPQSQQRRRGFKRKGAEDAMVCIFCAFCVFSWLFGPMPPPLTPPMLGSRADRTSVQHPALKGRARLTKPAARAAGPHPQPLSRDAGEGRCCVPLKQCLACNPAAPPLPPSGGSGGRGVRESSPRRSRAGRLSGSAKAQRFHTQRRRERRGRKGFGGSAAPRLSLRAERSAAKQSPASTEAEPCRRRRGLLRPRRYIGPHPQPLSRVAGEGRCCVPLKQCLACNPADPPLPPSGGSGAGG